MVRLPRTGTAGALLVALAAVGSAAVPTPHRAGARGASVVPDTVPHASGTSGSDVFAWFPRWMAG